MKTFLGLEISCSSEASLFTSWCCSEAQRLWRSKFGRCVYYRHMKTQVLLGTRL